MQPLEKTLEFMLVMNLSNAAGTIKIKHNSKPCLSHSATPVFLQSYVDKRLEPTDHPKVLTGAGQWEP